MLDSIKQLRLYQNYFSGSENIIHEGFRELKNCRIIFKAERVGRRWSCQLSILLVVC